MKVDIIRWGQLPGLPRNRNELMLHEIGMEIQHTIAFIECACKQFHGLLTGKQTLLAQEAATRPYKAGTNTRHLLLPLTHRHVSTQTPPPPPPPMCVPHKGGGGKHKTKTCLHWAM